MAGKTVQKEENKKAGKEERTAQYIRKASELFAAKGYRQCGVQEIIDYLGLSKGGFYWYFSSKEELYCKMCGLHCAKLQQIFKDLLKQDSITLIAIFESAKAVFDAFLKNKDQIHLMLDFHSEIESEVIRKELKALDAKWESILSALIQRCIDEEILPKTVLPDMLARQFIIFFQGLLMRFNILNDEKAVMEEWDRFLREMMQARMMAHGTGQNES